LGATAAALAETKLRREAIAHMRFPIKVGVQPQLRTRLGARPLKHLAQVREIIFNDGFKPVRVERVVNVSQSRSTLPLVTRIFCKAMVHVWQQTFRKPPRSSYHERQWATKIEGGPLGSPLPPAYLAASGSARCEASQNDGLPCCWRVSFLAFPLHAGVTQRPPRFCVEQQPRRIKESKSGNWGKW
jgi:hypothetical protein